MPWVAERALELPVDLLRSPACVSRTLQCPVQRCGCCSGPCLLQLHAGCDSGGGSGLLHRRMA